MFDNQVILGISQSIGQIFMVNEQAAMVWGKYSDSRLIDESLVTILTKLPGTADLLISREGKYRIHS